jgi:hypothetical protein
MMISTNTNDRYTPEKAFKRLHNGKAQAIVWNATNEIRAKNKRMSPDVRTIYISTPCPKEHTYA